MKNNFIYNLNDLDKPFKLVSEVTNFALGIPNRGVEVSFTLLANRVLKDKIIRILNKINVLNWEIQITGSAYNEPSIQLDSFTLQPKNKLEINEFLEVQEKLFEMNRLLRKELMPFLKNTNSVQETSISSNSKPFFIFFSVIDKESIVVNYSLDFLQYSYPLITRIKYIKKNKNKFHIPLKELYEYASDIKLKKTLDKLISKF